jgi:hypothetical protein
MRDRRHLGYLRLLILTCLNDRRRVRSCASRSRPGPLRRLQLARIRLYVLPIACVGGWTENNDISVQQLADAIAQVFAVEQGLVLQAMPHVFE